MISGSLSTAQGTCCGSSTPRDICNPVRRGSNTARPHQRGQVLHAARARKRAAANSDLPQDGILQKESPAPTPPRRRRAWAYSTRRRFAEVLTEARSGPTTGCACARTRPRSVRRRSPGVREAVDDERVEGVGVGDGDVDREVVTARDYEQAHRLRLLVYPVPERGADPRSPTGRRTATGRTRSRTRSGGSGRRSRSLTAGGRQGWAPCHSHSPTAKSSMKGNATARSGRLAGQRVLAVRSLRLEPPGFVLASLCTGRIPARRAGSGPPT